MKLLVARVRWSFPSEGRRRPRARSNTYVRPTDATGRAACGPAAQPFCARPTPAQGAVRSFATNAAYVTGMCSARNCSTRLGVAPGSHAGRSRPRERDEVHQRPRVHRPVELGVGADGQHAAGELACDAELDQLARTVSYGGLVDGAAARRASSRRPPADRLERCTRPACRPACERPRARARRTRPSPSRSAC